jgi:O-antigen ligase
LEGALLFLAAAGLLNTVSDYRRFFRILAAAGLLLSVMGIVWGGVINGRHALRAGSYSDPNYYAMALLSVAPILWIAFEWKSWWMKIGGFLVTALPLLLAVRTISRGGFVAMLAMLVVLFFLSSLKMKVIMASIAVLAVVILVAFLPDSVRARVAAAARISIPSGDPSTQNNDQVSVSSRETMLTTSINLTLAYPLLGVGPGNFGPTIVEFGKLQNMHWINLSTHNSYTQLSSETGIPGILLYLLMFGFAVKAVIRTLRRTSSGGAHPNAEIHRWSAGMLILLAADATCMFFLSEGYGMRNFLWFGLASGLQLLLPDDPKEEEEWVEVVPEPAVR